MKNVNATPTRAALRGPSAFSFMAIAIFIALACSFFVAPETARADSSRPSVLVVDSGLGDFESCGRAWLGEGAEEIASQNGLFLLKSNNARWWSNAGGQDAAPTTFLLGAPEAGHALTAEELAWALDRVRDSGAQPKTFVVAMGTPGLVVRQYLEDQASITQSSRADVVGVAFCGTPHNGYSQIASYEELTMWDAMALAAGISRADLVPGSEYLKRLNAGSFPRVVKTLTVIGQVGDLGFGLTDGAGVSPDYTLDNAVAAQLQFETVNASTAQNINLKGQWAPFTDKLNNPTRLVDSNLVDRISAIACYAISDEVQQSTKRFYDAWFADGSPVTHISNVLALDLSGSMAAAIEGDTLKIDAAKGAAREYLRAVEAYSGMPYPAPTTISTLGFNVGLVDICSGYNDAARQEISDIEVMAFGDTNIGAALEDALAKLQASPVLADKRILLLSDGERTVGQTNEEMLSGPVARAQQAGIVIDTIGFGDVGDSDAAFLQEVSRITGGIYCEASDVYELEVNFIRSYYTSLGESIVDEELPAGSDKSVQIGTIDSSTAGLSVGVIGDGFVPQVTLLCEGKPVDAANYTKQEENGFVALQCTGLAPGEYSVKVEGSDAAAHVFAARQRGMVALGPSQAQQDNSPLILLVITGVALVAAVGGVIGFTLSRKKKAA